MANTTTTQPTAEATAIEVALNTRDYAGRIDTAYMTPTAARELARQLLAAADQVDSHGFSTSTDQSADHKVEPHSRRPSECRICGRPITSTYQDGKLTSSTHA